MALLTAHALALVLSLASPLAVARENSMTLAMNLGDVLASESYCSLSYDQSAILAFIARNVEASDMGFTSTLSMMTMGKTAELSDMSASSKVAHCAQIARVAHANGFVR